MPDPISFESLLQEMVDVESIARWPQAEFTCHQVSSYDRATIAPDKPGWFANNDFSNYLRTETNSGRTEQVLMDAAGPGALVRFWLTAGGEKDGILRIYLDGETSPTIVFNGFDLLRGNLSGVDAPLLHPHPGYSSKSGGNNLYLPIPYARHCKITWEEKSQGQRYYNINYRTYAPGTAVTTFTLPQLQATRSLIQATNRALATSPKQPEGKALGLTRALTAGKRAALNLPAGSHAIQMLVLKLEPKNVTTGELEQALRSIILELEFDGKVTAWCPATDFFGSSVGINALQSWYRTVDTEGTMTCRWVMPYQKSGRVSLHNTGRAPVNATLRAITAPWKWDERSMHFHAAWHHEAGMHTPPHKDWNFVQIHGRGVYAGDSLALFNPVPTWYGEGDEKIWVDGESFPSHMGTGTEDYYGYSYAPQGIIQTPFNSHIRIDEKRTQGWNVMSRTRQLDGIPFKKSLKMDIELISWRPTTLSYSATTYWYAFPGAITNLKPQLEAAALPIPTLAEVQAGASKPNAVECETMVLLRKSGDFVVEAQDMEPWSRERWSGGKHLVVKATRVGDTVELEVPAPDVRPRKLTLYATRAVDFGTLQFRVNNKPCPLSFDGYAPEVQPTEPLPLGVFRPENGRFVVQVTVTGTNRSATGPRYYFGLDCLVLEPAS